MISPIKIATRGKLGNTLLNATRGYIDNILDGMLRNYEKFSLKISRVVKFNVER